MQQQPRRRKVARCYNFKFYGVFMPDNDFLIVNGFEVPAGLSASDVKSLDDNEDWENFFVPCPRWGFLVGEVGYIEGEDEWGFLIRYRLIYKNRDDALKRSLAMLGVNPENYNTFRDGYKESLSKKPVVKNSGRFDVEFIK